MKTARKHITTLIDIFRSTIHNDLKVQKIRNRKENNEMVETISSREKRELADRIKAMSTEELAIVTENIPVEMCLARIQDEINRVKALEDSIKNMAGLLER